MNENVIDVLLLRVVNIKDTKTLLQYAIPDGDSAKYKGFVILQDWIEGLNVFNSISKKDIGIPLKATYEYKKTYNGQAKMVLTKVYDDKTGSVLFQSENK